MQAADFGLIRVQTMRIALGLEYDGSSFCGWQTQPSRCAIQDAVETALAGIAGMPVATTCAGRTDAGVHALEQVLHFDTDALRPATAWVRGTNALLPAGVSVLWAHGVDESFHARYSASERRYSYYLLNRPCRPAVHAGKVGWFHQHLSVDAMRDGAMRLAGTHDFSTFRSAQCQAKNPVRTIHAIDIMRSGNLVRFDVSANAFLHHMVRNLVGALVYVGCGRREPDWIDEILQRRDRTFAAPTFSAAGLYLAAVKYPASWGLPQTGDAEASRIFLEGTV